MSEEPSNITHLQIKRLEKKLKLLSEGEARNEPASS